jgi:outer membrane protein assembly factor BamB
MLGTVEASPAPAVANWTVAPPEGSTRLIIPGLFSNGRVFTVFAAGDESTIAHAVDVRTGQVLWSGPLGSWQNLLVATAEDLLLATATDENGSTLTAYGGDTGDQRWQIELEQRPVGLLVQDDRILVPGSGNELDAFDLNSRHLLWQADLSQYDEAAADDAGMNQYFNMSGSRLAATNGVVGAIVSNGRLVGVDAADGTARWANDRTTNAATMVLVADGRFVATAAGSDMQGYDYDGAAGTPIPEINRCQAAISPRSGSTPGAIRSNGAGADRFDPATGDSPWGIETNRPAWIWTLDESNLIAMVPPGWDIVNDRPQDMFPCKIDGATGAISDLDPNVLADVVLDINSATPTGMAGFPNGGSFMIPDIDPAVAGSLPRVESDTPNSAAASWLQTVEGLTLVVLTDGTLMAMPAKSPDRALVDANPATPAGESANTGWIVSGPAGDHAESEDFGPVAENGRIFRSFYDVAAANHTQAVDMATGTVTWDVPLDVRGEAMASYGDLLLVGGRVGGLLKESALVALDQATGQGVWHAILSDFPAAIAVEGGRAFVLGANDQLDAVDLTSGASISASDIGGQLEPHASFPILGSQYRLAIDGDLLVVVLADGTVAGVDIESGAGIWWNLLSWSRGVRIAYLDGTLVVAEYGDMSDDLSESDVIGTPDPATPTASGPPVPASCLDSFYPASPVANSNLNVSPMLGVKYLRIDPNTGRIDANAHASEAFRPVPGK